ncbi:hypothetical protein [Rhizobium sp. NFR03]|uniref:ribonuclease T2 family protein n=1 Tax=Rhizobium sp. NFR03 TaxID=1566263 RepID=UPI0008B20F48|nr:hypothetical protein [Rhizobium sp. NFR03]SER54974.1 ribonuclease T2 [Rhizobium sp. NFR03]
MMAAYMEMMIGIVKRWLGGWYPALSSCVFILATCSVFDVQAAEVDVPRSPIEQRVPHPAEGTTAVGPSGELPVSQTLDAPPRATGKTGFVLGLSWLPAFCETKGKRPECVGQNAERADAKQLTLAGLRPVRNSFCKVSETLQAEDRKRDWMALPAVPLSADVARQLSVSMPGTASGLDRHTWLRSGSCQVLDPDAYFSLQIRLLEAVNTSAVGALFRSRIGSRLSEDEVKAAFDRSFAAGAGDRIRLQCRQVGDRMLVTGLTIGLSATMEATSDLATLIHAAAPVRSRCGGGVVDAAGRLRPERSALAGQTPPRTDGEAKVVDVR